MDDKGERVCGVVSILLCVLNGVSLILFTLSFLKVRALSAELFADFGGRLPAPTQLLLAPPAWAIVLLVLALLGILIAKEWLMPKWKPLILNIGWLLAGIVAMVVIVVLLSLPLVNAMTAIAQPNNAPPPSEEAL